MSMFDVTIKTRRAEVTYRIEKHQHDDTAVNAAEEALRTFARHGHSRFPFNDGELSLKIVEIDDA